LPMVASVTDSPRVGTRISAMDFFLVRAECRRTMKDGWRQAAICRRLSSGFFSAIPMHPQETV
jgi:hypothetical protein